MSDNARLYLELLKKTLTHWGEDEFVPIHFVGSAPKVALKRVLKVAVDATGFEIGKTIRFDPRLRECGRDWPAQALTMIGMKRLNNLQYCVETIIRDDIPGDLIETGVWRGGASIFMRGALEVLGDKDRIVWCADSFQGFPIPDTKKYPADIVAAWHHFPHHIVSEQTVRSNFERFGLLDNRVKFLVGWFNVTLPEAPIKSLAILRLDGDMYQSTMDALNSLYHKVAPGGFVIVDDYGIPEDTCRRAVSDFRRNHRIDEEIVDIDGWGAYWRKRL